MHDFSAALGEWSSFYVMIGSSAAALTGLMFVVITLVSDTKRIASPEGVSTFSTPTVVHFCSVLLTCAFMAAPFRSLTAIAILLGVTGAGGMFYVIRIGLLTRRLAHYTPDAEDWTWHVGLPLLAYATLVAAALAIRADPAHVLFAPPAAIMLLIFIGIHNAWDVVTFIAVDVPEPETNESG